MNYRTRQEIFNVAYRGLASQGFRQSLGEYGCAYRGDNDSRCAIGWCIPDANYKEKFDRSNFGLTVLHGDVQAAANISWTEEQFGRALQHVHDDHDEPKDLKAALEEFARKRELTIPEGFDDLLETETGVPVTELEDA